MLAVVRLLDRAAARGLVERPPHRAGHRVGVHDHLAVHVPRGAAGGLHQRGPRPQVALLVRVQDRHQRDLRDVQALAEEVDPDQHVELAHPQLANDLHPLQRVDLGVQVAHADAEVPVVVGEVLGHALGQRGDQHPLAPVDPAADFAEQVVDLAGRGPDVDPRVNEPRRADELLDHPRSRFPQFVRPGGRRDVDGLVDEAFELGEGQGPVVERRREAEPVLDQVLLARAVALVHPPDLRDRGVAFIHDQQKVLGEIVDQRGRRLPGGAAREVARVVLDPLAEADLADHLQVEPRALLDSLGFEQLAALGIVGDPLLELGLDPGEGALHPVGRNHVVAAGVDRRLGDPAHHLAPQRVDLGEGFDPVAEQLDADRVRLGGRGEDIDHVPAHAERAPVKVDVVALVLDVDQARQNLLPADRHPLFERQQHPVVGFRRTQPVDARHRGDDDDVVPLEQRAGGGVTHPVDRVVDGRVFLDVGVGLGEVGLRLVVIVIAHEVADGVPGEKRLELVVELGRERLVVDEHERGALDPGDHVGHGEGLARAGDTEEHLMGSPLEHALAQGGDRLSLVALGAEVRNEGERRVHDAGATDDGGIVPRPRPTCLGPARNRGRGPRKWRISAIFRPHTRWKCLTSRTHRAYK